MEEEKKVRDLIYLDFDKTASILSQIEGGLLREIQSGVEASKEDRNVRQYDMKIFKPEFGGIATETTSQIESRVLHHGLLVRTEASLFQHGFAVDLNHAMDGTSSKVDVVRSKLSGSAYVRAEGWALIEDYQRIKNISKDFNALGEFIARCAMQQLEQSEDYKKLQLLLDSARAEAKAEQDRNKRAKALNKVVGLETQFHASLREMGKIHQLPEWLIAGLSQFIDTFMPGRINLFIYPFEEIPSFRLIANLKRDCFVEGDIENLLFAYGTRPNVKLTVLGLITSMPEQAPHPFDPMREFEGMVESLIQDERAVEKGLRGLHRGMEIFEKYVRFSNYPSVTVYPLAVYRTIRKADN